MRNLLSIISSYEWYPQCVKLVQSQKFPDYPGEETRVYFQLTATFINVFDIHYAFARLISLPSSKALDLVMVKKVCTTSATVVFRIKDNLLLG